MDSPYNTVRIHTTVSEYKLTKYDTIGIICCFHIILKEQLLKENNMDTANDSSSVPSVLCEEIPLCQFSTNSIITARLPGLKLGKVYHISYRRNLIVSCSIGRFIIGEISLWPFECGKILTQFPTRRKKFVWLKEHFSNRPKKKFEETAEWNSGLHSSLFIRVCSTSFRWIPGLLLACMGIDNGNQWLVH